MALAFHQAGAKVFVGDVDSEALSAMREEYPSIGTGMADVSQPSQVDAMFDAALAFMGGLDVMVNNAGIAGPTAKIEDISIEDWDRTIAIDLNSMFYCLRHAVPLLKASGGGSIINISSIAGRLGYPLRTPYSAAKWGVIGLTKSLAIELGTANIRVNAILPGAVAGDRVNRVIAAKAEAKGVPFEEELGRFVNPISLKHMVSPEDVANMALFLATPAGASITGQALSVCGDHAYLA